MAPIVVIGSGLAAYSVIRELRKLERDLPLTLVTRDSGDYYSKPMLSNALAQGKDAAGLVSTQAAEMAAQWNFTLHNRCQVDAIDTVGKRVSTSQGELAYSRLVLALGADPIRLPLQGAAADAVMAVNDIDDYARLHQAMRDVRHITILGGGLIGCEFANDWAAAGYGVSVIDPGTYPLASLMPERAGRQLLAPLAQLGVDWRFGRAVSQVEHAPEGYRLTLTDGEHLHTGLVLSAVGLRPRTALAQAAGLAVGRGIQVDAAWRSSVADIHALGDCAELDGRVLPFVQPILHAARALAQTLCGRETRVDLPAMPVVVKTPAHPVAILPVAREARGVWRQLEDGGGVKMGFFDAEDVLRGFALTGRHASARVEMMRYVGQRLPAAVT